MSNRNSPQRLENGPRLLTPAAQESSRFFFCLLLATALSGPSSASSADAERGWNQFRGPSRSGVSTEVDLLRTWPPQGPPILWKKPIGEGFSAISVAGSKLFTVFAEGEQEYLAAFRAADGQELWRLEIGGKFRENFGNGPRSTPTWSAGALFVLGSSGRLVAAREEDGQLLWQVDLTQSFPITASQSLVAMAPTPPGPQLPVFGYTTSPLLIDDLVVVQTGAGDGRSVAAFDRRSGEPRWSALDDEIGYSSPLRIDLAGQLQILVLTGADVVALSLQGAELWRFPWAPTPSQPLFLPPGKIFVSTVNEVGAKLLQVRRTSAGFEPEVVWENPRFRNNWNSSVFHEGRIYGFDNATFRCMDAASGEFCWSHRGLGQGTLILSDGLLFVLSDRGELFVAEATPDAFEEKGRVQVLSGRSWTAPVLSDGVVYLRNHQEMAAVSVRATSR